MNDDDDIVLAPTQSPTIILQSQSPTSQSPTPNDNDIPEDEGDNDDEGEEEGEEGKTFSVSHILLYERRELGSVYHMCILYVPFRL